MYAGKVLGIDYGSKRVGVAVSDPTRLIAQGVTTILNDDRMLQNLQDIISGEDVNLIVVGMPYGADGEVSRKGEEVLRFIEELRRQTDIDIITWDESYSSVNAQRSFIETGMKKRKRQEKHRVDAMAARFFLQEYLDSLKT